MNVYAGIDNVVMRFIDEMILGHKDVYPMTESGQGFCLAGDIQSDAAAPGKGSNLCGHHGNGTWMAFAAPCDNAGAGVIRRQPAEYLFCLNIMVAALSCTGKQLLGV